MKNISIVDNDTYHALVENHEILSKYSYVGIGAKYWDALTDTLYI